MNFLTFLSDNFLQVLAVILVMVIIIICWSSSTRRYRLSVEQVELLSTILEQQQQQSTFLRQLVEISSEPLSEATKPQEIETASIPRFSAER